MIILAIWYIIGVAGFIYWWTTDQDLTTSTIPIALLVGITGPMSWVFGWLIHGRNPPRVLLKARHNKRTNKP